MSLTVENLEKNMAKLTITVPAAEFVEAMTESYKKQKGKISVPGFRKGKVPQTYLEKMYGRRCFMKMQLIPVWRILTHLRWMSVI